MRKHIELPECQPGRDEALREAIRSYAEEGEIALNIGGRVFMSKASGVGFSNAEASTIINVLIDMASRGI